LSSSIQNLLTECTLTIYAKQDCSPCSMWHRCCLASNDAVHSVVFSPSQSNIKITPYFLSYHALIKSDIYFH
jgi:hypothetical protein